MNAPGKQCVMFGNAGHTDVAGSWTFFAKYQTFWFVEIKPDLKIEFVDVPHSRLSLNRLL